MNKIINEEIEFSFLDIVELALKQKKKIFVVTTLFFLLSIFYSFKLEDQYESYAILKVSDKNSFNQSQMGISSSLSNLGLLTGTSSHNNSAALAIETLKSKDFFDHLIENEIFLDLMLDNKNSFSYEELHNIFLRDLDISNNKANNTTRISIHNNSAESSYKLLKYVIKSLNNYIRDKEVKKSDSQILFLEEKLLKTQHPDIRSIIAELIESNIRDSMISANSDEYVFIYIDSPRIPENKSLPNRSLIVLIVTLLSFISSTLMFICIGIFKKYKHNWVLFKNEK